jgi:hypothetical protein
MANVQEVSIRKPQMKKMIHVVGINIIHVLIAFLEKGE